MFIFSTKMGENKKGTCVFVKIVRFWWILVSTPHHRALQMHYHIVYMCTKNA